MINYNGSESGVGAAQAWTDRRGKGKLWITQSAKDDRVEYEMEFGRFPRMTSSFNLRGGSAGPTTVEWRSAGRLPGGPFYGYFGSFFSNQMKHEYDQSLERLKQLIESD